MKLPRAYIFSSSKGFTLFEALIVITILVLLIGLFFPVTINFYNTQQFDIHFRNIAQSLRRAQLRAMAGEKESSFGVYFELHQYVLFKGNSYTERDIAWDEIFELPESISITGLSEIVFSRIKGIPSDIGDVVLTTRDKSEIININEVGMIDY